MDEPSSPPEPDASPSCERLALVGEETVKAYVSLLAADRASIPISAAGSSDGVLREDRLGCGSLAAPRELVHWRDALAEVLARTQ